ncbi:hypothetical protein [Teredinibacter franksiae]|uniref:hypothetical protein n=1 Tax=Teredinibacter franksiae TaxID=2761453 RepID=UPI0016271D16|nr:hypothetical protein [Teredinibacter franksiae]
MKYLAMIFTLALTVLASSAYGCDEKCAKDKAEAEKNVQFPGYMSWKFCEDTRMDFMTSSMESLDKYRSKHFDTRYKGGIRNIKNYMVQRKAWLVECDTYMQLTGKGRIFEDNKTTKKIFKAMDSVTKELGDLIAGVTYSSSLGQDSSVVLNGHFETLFTAVDDHKNIMLLKGRYVTR